MYFEQGEGECVLYYTTKEDFIFDDTKTYRTVIKAMDPAMQKAVVLTQGDPYVVFSEGRVAEFNKAFSHYTVTKVFIVLFIAATYIFAVKKSKRRE